MQNPFCVPEILTSNRPGVPWNLTFRQKCLKEGQNPRQIAVPKSFTYVCTGRKLRIQAQRAFRGCEAPKTLTFGKSTYSL